MSVDLHLHTYYSDGSWSPQELVEKAIALKLSHIAITDHDTITAIEPAKIAAQGRIEIIPGVEINCVMPSESGDLLDVHILGYFVDTKSKALLDLLARQQQARNQYVSDIIARLAQEGITLTYDEIKSQAGIGSIGRPHISQVMVSRGFATDKQDAFTKYLLRTSSCFVERQSVSPQEAIAAIIQAGGVASLAHPAKTPGIDEAIIKLKAHGLSAVEAYHRKHSLNTVKHYLRFAHKNDLAITGGSDCHGQSAHHEASIGQVIAPLEAVVALKELATQRLLKV
jgi:predicted metal-dependent phosphoesterase TrpH